MRRKLIAAGLAGLLLWTSCAPTPTPIPVDADLRIDAAEFGFAPSGLEITAGQRVRLTLRNRGSLEHDLSITEFPMEVHLRDGTPAGPGEAGHPEFFLGAPAGQSTTIEFTPTQPGTYRFFCNVPGHVEGGMNGVLIVHPP